MDGGREPAAGAGGRVTPAEPRWLRDSERTAWRGLINVMTRLPAALDAQLRRDAGLSHFEYSVLVGLSEAPNRTLAMARLAEFTCGSLSRLSHAVKRLEDKGWVRRFPCAADGRVTNAILTDLGFEKLAATAPGHVETVRDLVVEALSREQLNQLTAICGQVLDRLDTPPPPTRPC
ncbi:DNA-binding transcriptional regulator, MarR family [Parafrankia irregularis]|uniref:DNA-binding transcriptional regulator, MarR family n=1 Tax=Parafrankia irregularis TaxID=795642 RepID=A0A0S4QJX0_9ACTN|nr:MULTISPECIES: MarR family transcriptional regulator [Parafrankia]MBE3202143.1 MarR family transcriptional regulator [Parafrankia sp. CH37]CUU55925.1 DNA-binding transcriptional regulator, MarR family [Parafrankia irregularis]